MACPLPPASVRADDSFAQFLGGDLGRFTFKDNRPGIHDQHAVGRGHDLAHVVGHHHNRHSLARQILDDLMNLALGLDVDADGRTVENKDARVGGQPLPQDDALLVAAE